MKRLLFTLLLASPMVSAEYESLKPVLESIKPVSITILGERHQQPESMQLFQRLVGDALEQNPCLVVALEIASNQQTTLDNAVPGQAGKVVIPDMIDHAPYRQMLDGLLALKQQGSCLRLVAIDAGEDVNMDRDKWMASNITKQMGETPVLALLGNMHALRRVKWNDGIVSPSVSELLSDSGRQVKTFLQHWPGDCSADRSAHFYEPSSPATSLALGKLFSVMNAEEPTNGIGVVDGTVAWECDNLPRDDVSHSHNSG